MRTLSLLAPAALILVLGACASTPGGVTPPPAGFDASATQFEGWARVADGEIRLYARERDLTQGFPTDCVSAVLPRNAQRAAADLNGAKVRLFGRTAAWAARDGAQTMQWQGSRLVNNCRRDTVIQADRVEVIQ
ncbi:hypothetical protein [Brevundimonas sp.]|uniref:hypothetical protein n=1 Tax=Brevundimonas sp. TaxID=1871086 RepID=UPI0025C026D3|nr:hypothetical protein [Brevundimonas sp.]